MQQQVYKLKTPVKWGESVVEELTFRKPKAKDLRKLPMNPNTSDLIDLAGNLCAQPPRFMDELEIEDFTGMMEIVSGFLPGSQ